MSALDTARELMKDVTPLKRDCGRICGAACCRPDEDGRGGMLLFPGEEKYYSGGEWYRLEPTDDVTGARLLVCSGTCPREERPLACRLFPLLPRPDGDVKPDRRARGVCPLSRGGLEAFDPAFVSAAREAARALCGEEPQRMFLRELEANTMKALRETGLWEG